MSDIKPGDWVSIAGCGPYKVAPHPYSDDSTTISIALDGGRAFVLRAWCVKVPAPFRPEPGTSWSRR